MNRPIVFIFNGGPGASSSPLHMYSFGPVLLQKGKDTTIQLNNENCLLDIADLVFIDPLGTGVTKIYNDTAANQYYDVEKDAQCFVDIIHHWLDQHHRKQSPLFICGESYGTVRAAKMVGMIKDLPLKGVLLFSSILDLTIMAPVVGNEMPYILDLPTMSAVAWYHHKNGIGAQSAEEAYQQAAIFANTTYAKQLMKGNQITDLEKQKTAKQLSQFIGLDPAIILKNNLRVTTDSFEMLLLADQHLRIGKLNARVTQKKVTENYSAKEDPSLFFNTDIKKDAVGKYFKENLGIKDDRIYVAVNFTVNGKWKWSSMDAYLGYYSVLPDLENAFKSYPDLQLFSAGGLYDLATPLYITTYLLDRSSIPKSHIHSFRYSTGHSIFDDKDQLTDFSKQVHQFIKVVQH